jgi:hypothetical protein
VAAREDGDTGVVVRKILPRGADALFDTASLGSAAPGMEAIVLECSTRSR